MDEGYQDGEAMLLLAQSYEKQGEQDKANAYYPKREGYTRKRCMSFFVMGFSLLSAMEFFAVPKNGISLNI